MVILQTEEGMCPLGQMIERNMGKWELLVVHPDWTPWCEKSSGTNELEKCRGQIAQSLVCWKKDFDSYPEGASERF